MSKSSKVIITLLLLFISVLADDNILVSSKYLITPEGSGVIKEGRAELNLSSDKLVSLTINDVPTPSMDVEYVIHITLTASAGARVFSYIENGSNGWQNKGKWIEGNGGRQTVEIKFRLTKEVSKPSYIVVRSQAKGTLTVESVTVDAVPVAKAAQKKAAPAVVTLDAPFNRGNGIFSTNSVDFLNGHVAFHDANAKTYTLVLNGADGRRRFQQEGKTDAGECVFRIPSPAKQGDIDKLVLSLFDTEGKTIHEESIDIHNYPPSPSEVVFRKDGVALVNGKPFFMIAHWWHTRRGDYDGDNVNYWYDSKQDVLDDMAFLKEAGFNTVFLGHRRFEDLELAQKAGMMAIVENRRIKDRETWQAEVRANRGNPALLAYYGRDEAMALNVPLEEALAESRMLWEADPYHPIFYNEAPLGTVEEQRAYAVISDVLGRDIYPVKPIGAPHSDMADRTLAVVGKQTDLCMDAVNHAKPVWMILQAWAWGHDGKNKRRPYSEMESRYPTYEENRFMAYDAIVHGATGIMYHYLGYTVHIPDSFWASLRKVTLELSWMSPILTSETVPPPFECTSPAVRMLAKQHDGHVYCILVNESEQALTAVLKGVETERLNVLLDPLPLFPSKGIATLDMPPYSVRVLSTAEFPDAATIFKPDTYVPYHRQPKIASHK